MAEPPTEIQSVYPGGPELCLTHPLGEPHLRSLQLCCDTWRSHPNALPIAYAITLDADRLRTLRAMIDRELAEMGEADVHAETLHRNASTAHVRG